MKLFSIVLAAFVSACMATGYQPQGGSFGTSYAGETTATATTSTSVTFINGYELSWDEKGQLDQLLGGTLPQGRYTIDAQYNFGREGEAPFVNLAQYAQASGSSYGGNGGGGGEGKAFSIHSRDAAGQGSTLVSDGQGCMIMSTPSGSLSSGC